MNSNIKKVLKKIIPGIIKDAVKKEYTMFTSEDVEQANRGAKSRNNLALLKNIILKRSIRDEMYFGDGSHYLQVGLSAISCIEEAIKRSEVKVIEKILDMPCGYGRVLRFVAKYFTSAELTACDTNKDGVDFCCKEFGAIPVYSITNLKEFNLNKKFDLIWCGSLATHFDSNDTTELLKFFYRHLNSGGLLIFSMHGKRAIENLNSEKYTYALSNESIEELLAETKETGYGYVDYHGQNKYGVSIATPEWMEAKLHEVGKWRNFIFSESAWIDHHDIYSVVKV
jgi:SAM-dependent methyltransferase